jgi:hypothetical protein
VLASLFAHLEDGQCSALQRLYTVEDALYYAVRPMLAVSGGRMILLSTPFGKRGIFHEVWTSEEEWDRYEVPAADCPRISEEFLEEEREALGLWWFAQEYQCRFMDTVDQVFASEAVDRAMRADIQPLSLGGSPGEASKGAP